MPIYTKTGDKGKTSLFSGKRVLKSDLRVESYGTVDELNSIIGVALSFLPQKKEFKKPKEILLSIQNRLFYIGSYLADLKDVINDVDLEKETEGLEKNIDQMTNKMPPLSSFILPDGTKFASHLHLARTVSRRAERNIVKLDTKAKIDPRVVKYINRLSDLFFTMSRFANYVEKKKETTWSR